MKSEETYNKIKDQIEEDQTPSLKPEEGEWYYYLDECGDIEHINWEGRPLDWKSLSIGNVFKTEEKAKQKVEELKAIQRVKEYIKKEFGYDPEDWADWENRKQSKWFICWEGGKVERLCTIVYNWTKHYSPIGYLKSEEDAKQLIEDKQEDLEIIYKPK